MSDARRKDSPAPLRLMLTGVLIGMIGLALQLARWSGPGLLVQTFGALLAIAGILVLAFGKD